MSQSRIANNLSMDQMNDLVEKLGGPEEALRWLSSRRVIRLVLEDKRLEYLGEEEFPAMPELFVGDLPTDRVGFWSRCSSAVGTIDKALPIPAVPAIRLMKFGVLETIPFSELREILVPNDVYPESPSVLRARIISSVNRRQPWGETTGGQFGVDGKQNLFPVVVDDGSAHFVILRYCDFAGAGPNRQSWVFYSLEDKADCAADRNEAGPGDLVYVAEATHPH